MRVRWRAAALAWALAFGCEHSLPDPEAPACSLKETNFEVAVSNVDAVDVLIVLDVSPSMADEQQALARELPETVRALVSGALPDGSTFSPVRDLHIGVVSADLGAGANADGASGCTARGDDGAFARGGTCGAALPPFADYFDPRATLHPLVLPPSREAAEALVEDVACRAELGSAGCGRSQPLEAVLRALGTNPSFLRNDPAQGLSAVHVLLISDGDDCSLRDPDGSPAAAAGDEDAACSARAELLSDVQRYVDGLRALRPGNESLVSFSAIIGLPPEFAHVPQGARDWSTPDDRDAFYARLLADPRMQPQLLADGTLAPVCESSGARATPAPRIVETLRRLGDAGTVHSICDADWTPAVAALLERSISTRQLQSGCWFPLLRATNGLTPCRMLWELPLPEAAHRGSPTRCEDLPFLSPHAERPMSAEGRALCEVPQLAVEGEGDDRQLESGDGWFYDDFSMPGCPCGLRRDGCGSLVFVPNAVPSGVTVRMNCFETQYVVPADGALDINVDQPEVFDPCDPEDPRACARKLADPGPVPEPDRFDRRLSCDPPSSQCVLPCTDGSCPTGWTCSDHGFCDPAECRVPG